MRRSSLTRKLVGFCLTALGLAACQAVAGIEDRTLDPDAGKPVYTQQCHDYCDQVMDACTGENAVYSSKDFCLGVCANLDSGDAEDTHNNTVACREFYALQATAEPADNCALAGPGGGDTCGSDCDAYCQLYPKVCPKEYPYKSTAECLRVCRAVPDQSTFDVARDHGGDTIECRLVHVSSATIKPVDHCKHAPLAPEKTWCIGPLDEPPTCEAFCAIERVACTKEFAQFESEEQCLAVCKALPQGTNVDATENTIGCRRYHSFNATTLGPDLHCAHTGPTGDGHCGHDDLDNGYTGNCDSYCTLLAAACPTEFESAKLTPESCMEQCITLPESGAEAKYSVRKAEASKDLSCRVLHAVRAFADPTACASAMGEDQCAP